MTSTSSSSSHPAGAPPSSAARSAHPRPSAATPIVVTCPLEPRAGAALDPLVEELSVTAVELLAADPSTIVNRSDLVAVAASFSRVLEQAWLPGRAIAVCEIASVVDEEPTEPDVGASTTGGGARLAARLLVGIAGTAGTTAIEATDLGRLTRRTLGRYPTPFRIGYLDPHKILDVEPVDVARISQRLASVDFGDQEASVVSRWDRDASSWIELADAVLSRPGTRVRTSLLATEMGVDDVAWLRREQTLARALAANAVDQDIDLHHRANRVLLTLTDVLESYRSPLFCGEVTVISETGPLGEVFLREVGGAITNEFDVVHRGETTTVAARQRWVGGYEVERNVTGMDEALARGLPARGGLGPRRLVDVLSLTEAACAFQWPIPAGAPVPTIPSTTSRTLPARAGVATSGGLIGHDPNDREIRLGEADRAAHVHVIGATGSGKSTFLDRLCADDIAEGRGLVLVDRHGPLAQRARRRLELANRPFVMLDASDPRTARLSLFPRRTDGSIDPDRMNRHISRLIEAVTTHLPDDWSGPRFRDAARMALTVVAYSGAELTSVIMVLTDHAHAKVLMSTAADAGTPVPRHVSAWMTAHHSATNNDRAAVAQWVASKFEELANSSTLPQVVDTFGDGFDLADAIADGTPVLVDLGSIDEIEARLLGSLVIGAVLDAAFERPPEDRSFLPICIDEAQKFYVQNLERALAESRKYGVSVTLGHQHASQFAPRARDAVLGSCSLTVAFRLTDQDATAMAPRFGLRPRDLAGQPSLQATLHRADLGGAEPAYTCLLDPYEDLDEPAAGGHDEHGPDRDGATISHDGPRDPLQAQRHVRENRLASGARTRTVPSGAHRR